MKKVLLVFGTRPEAIKMAPLLKMFEQYPMEFKTIVCVTGQNRELLDQVLSLFTIIPDVDLDIMTEDQDLYDVTTRVLTGMKKVLITYQPDIVLVHGDTTTSLAAALAAFYQQIPIGHIEAGLRTHHSYNPWPEEVNRQIIGRMATYHFAPTASAKQNLLAEGVAEDSILVTGNTGIDALHMVVGKLASDPLLIEELQHTLCNAGYNLQRLDGISDACLKRRMVLVTGHRREHFGKGIQSMISAVKHLAEKYPQVDFVFMNHPNPHVKEALQKILGTLSNSELTNFYLMKPLPYHAFVYLMTRSYLLLTDSGGIQEEAPSLGKPVLVMRDTTERTEALASGIVRLIGTDHDEIIAAVSDWLDTAAPKTQPVSIYGDAHACSRIVSFLAQKLKDC